MMLACDGNAPKQPRTTVYTINTDINSSLCNVLTPQKVIPDKYQIHFDF